MFQVDRPNNRLVRLGRTTFSEAGFTERAHLQEWLATDPGALGEALGDDLLIIQKEFDGFDGTRERLDLLALDRQGQLVVIENKLDDSGRDVVWQALKYAAYCSSLKKAEIVDIFQRHLDGAGGGDAVQAICEFLGEDAWEEVVLNPGSDQRIVFVAANFRREVTATVLWLRDHGIDARCVRAVPYRFGEEVLLDLQQVIPTPEAADYMIRMAQKDTEAKATKGRTARQHEVRVAFWEAVADAFATRPCSLFPNVAVSDRNWLPSSSDRGCFYSLNINRTIASVKLSLARPDASENKMIFDRLFADKEAIETSLGDRLEWRRMDRNKASRIELHLECNGHDPDEWDGVIDFMRDASERMEREFRKPLLDALTAMQASGS